MPFAHESDLRWFLDGSCDAALGMKSNHASFVARMEGSTGGTPTEDSWVQDYLVQDACRARRIREIFERLPHDSQRVLIAFYRPDKLAPYWRDLTHLLPLVKAYDAEKHGPPAGGLGLRMTTTKSTPEQRADALAIRQGAARLIERAHREYATLAAAFPRERQRFCGVSRHAPSPGAAR